MDNNSIFTYVGYGKLCNDFKFLNENSNKSSKNVYLKNLFDEFNSEYYINSNFNLKNKKNAVKIHSIIQNIEKSKSDSIFICGNVTSGYHNILISFKDLKMKRGKTSGPILCINKSQIGKDISYDFYRNLYKKWKFCAEKKRYNSSWKDLKKLYFNFKIDYCSTNQSFNYLK